MLQNFRVSALGFWREVKKENQHRKIQVYETSPHSPTPKLLRRDSERKREPERGRRGRDRERQQQICLLPCPSSLTNPSTPRQRKPVSETDFVWAGDSLPLLHLVASRAAGRHAGLQERGRRAVLPRPTGRPAERRHPAHGDPVPLGPAQPAAEDGRLAQPVHRGAVQGLRRPLLQRVRS